MQLTKHILLLCTLLFTITYGYAQEKPVELIILGTVQDGGSPHIGCKKTCCSDMFAKPDNTRKVVALGVVNHATNKRYLFEATPDFPSQMRLLNELSNTTGVPDGIFLTHAHIGHYTGLMYLGREALGAKEAPVYTMPKMKAFLEQNGPWEQLVMNKNIKIQALTDKTTVALSPNLNVTPFIVPHRDEYSETVGYIIAGPNKRVLFIPDINKWGKWKKSIVEEIKKVDYAFIDATFFDNAEVNYRDISEIPHPFIVESMQLFESLSPEEKSKIHFIHFNHTNPALNPESEKYKMIIKKGFKVAQFGATLKL